MVTCPVEHGYRNSSQLNVNEIFKLRASPGGPGQRSALQKYRTLVGSLVWGRPICYGGSKPTGHNYESPQVQSLLRNEKSEMRNWHTAAEEQLLFAATEKKAHTAMKISTAKNKVIKNKQIFCSIQFQFSEQPHFKGLVVLDGWRLSYWAVQTQVISIITESSVKMT